MFITAGPIKSFLLQDRLDGWKVLFSREKKSSRSDSLAVRGCGRQLILCTSSLVCSVMNISDRAILKRFADRLLLRCENVQRGVCVCACAHTQTRVRVRTRARTHTNTCACALYLCVRVCALARACVRFFSWVLWALTATSRTVQPGNTSGAARRQTARFPRTSSTK